MFVICVDMYTIQLTETLITEYSPEQPSKISLKIGYVLFVVQQNQISHLKNKKRCNRVTA